MKVLHDWRFIHFVKKDEPQIVRLICTEINNAFRRYYNDSLHEALPPNQTTLTGEHQRLVELKPIVAKLSEEQEAKLKEERFRDKVQQIKEKMLSKQPVRSHGPNVHVINSTSGFSDNAPSAMASAYTQSLIQSFATRYSLLKNELKNEPYIKSDLLFKSDAS